MKITCDREKLLAAWQIARNVAPTRSPKPILQNIKLEVQADRATLLATDLETGIRIDIAGVDAEQPGGILLPVGRFGSILTENSDANLRMESDGQTILVRGDRSEFKLPAADPHEFPSVVEFNESRYQTAPARLVRELIRRTVFATDNESSRYALGGVLLEFGPGKITAVGTDGRRLAKMEGPATSVGDHHTVEGMTIVPSKAMTLIERTLVDPDAEVQIAARGNDVLVRCGRITIYSRLVEGRFPRWRDVVPQRNVHKIALVVGPFYSAVRQAAIVTSEESRGIDFSFAGGRLILAARAADTGQARVELPIDYSGGEVGIALDPRFVSDFLRVLDPESSITFDIKDSEAAAMLLTDDGYNYVIMPLARDK